MKEKIVLRGDVRYMNGYFKPKGKWAKRRIHKMLRRMHGTQRPGIMNAIGCEWNWV